jgi:DNA-binding response OmpR family regulator
MRVLVVEDEKRIATNVMKGLVAAGYVVDMAFDGEDGWFRGDSEAYDAAILDLGLPIIDGISILKRWRSAARTLPVIILTARGGWREKVEGIDAGADDYVAKPFQIEELLARLRAVTRRRFGHATSIVTIGALAIDMRQRSVHVGDRPVELTALEFRLLAALAQNRGRVLSQAELSEQIHDQDIERDSNAIEALVRRLRRKLGDGIIATRRGHGYLVERLDG